MMLYHFFRMHGLVVEKMFNSLLFLFVTIVLVCEIDVGNVKVENKSNIILPNEKLFVTLHRR